MVWRRFVALAFFCSGFCGLLYQVVWLRLAFAAFGIVTPVLSVVLSVFMLGIALGSWAAGPAVEAWRRRTGRSALVVYGGAELLIGLGALAVPALFALGERWLRGLGESDSTQYLLASAAAMTVAILPWCVLMGATVPTMMAFVRERGGERTSFSFLYLANALGAAYGAGLTALALVELLGFAATLRWGAAINVAIGIVSIAGGARLRHGQEREASLVSLDERMAGSTPVATAGAALDVKPAPPPLSLPFADSLGPRTTLAFLAVTGLAAMGMEVVWTRAFTPALSTTIYAFAALLASYLLATGVGSLLYRRHLARGTVWPVGFLAALLAPAALLSLLLNDARFTPWPALVCLSIAPLCALLGYLTPRLVDGYSAGDPRRAGRAYAWNVLGCIFGPLVAGYLLLPALGVKGALVVLAAPFLLLFAAAAPRWRTSVASRAAWGAAALALLAVALGWSRTLEDPRLYDDAQVRRDHTATVISEGHGMARRLLVNGIGITGMTPTTKMMAHWPLLHLERPPRRVLVICFGMGTTFRSAMAWGGEVYAVELVPSVRDAFGFYHDDAAALLREPRAHVVVDDGRRFLARAPLAFDVVTLDPPPPPEAAGSSLLYSRELYALVRTRLAEGGIVQQWLPPSEPAIHRAVLRSLVESFTHVRAFAPLDGEGTHFLASMRPLPRLAPGELAARLPPAAARDLLEWWPDSTVDHALATIAERELSVPALLDGGPPVRITDDGPFNEYFLLRRHFGFSPAS